MTDRKKTVIVTGASKGIGRAILRRLSQDGYRVIGLARSRPADLGENEEFHLVDLADLGAARVLLERIAAESPVYGLVNNASAAPARHSLDGTAVSDMEDAFLLNLNAPLVCTQAVIAGMRERRQGRIVNLAARSALGMVNRTAYSAAKAGVIGMSRTWALELAQHNITVNVVAPGPVATEMFRTASPPEEPRTQAMMKSIPLQRVVEPSEVAHAVAFLMDSRAGTITGQTLFVDGGLSISTAHS